MASEQQQAGVPSVEDCYEPNHDERSRQSFVGVFRDFTKRNMRGELERLYREEMEPAIAARGEQVPETGREIEALMENVPYYRFYSSLRYNSQEMMYLAAMDPIERVAGEMNVRGKAIAEARPTGGTLELNADVALPRYTTALDVHLAPGSFHAEYTEDDLSQAALLAYGSSIGLGANVHRAGDLGGVGRSIGHWLTQKFPDFRPRRILDIGTQSGKNLFGYIDSYPDIAAYGVDVSAPTLRFGHAKAEKLGYKVHFSQQDAENLSFPDGYFDVIVSSFFFHEVPIKVTQNILAECRRLLAPGGVMAHMELPSHSHCDAYQNFYWDWDTKYNNEPFYEKFRSQDFNELMTKAGFPAADCFTTTVPNYETTNLDEYSKYLTGELETPMHGLGGWFVFGATDQPSPY